MATRACQLYSLKASFNLKIFFSFFSFTCNSGFTSTGMFGENFTTEGLLEDQANIGDEYQIGSAKFAVTQPRMPCYKLAIKFESQDIIKKLFTSAKCGIYFKVLEEGEVGAGDEIKLVKKDENNVRWISRTNIHLGGWNNALSLPVLVLFRDGGSYMLVVVLHPRLLQVLILNNISSKKNLL